LLNFTLAIVPLGQILGLRKVDMLRVGGVR
jgi:hypothetical protein